MNYALITIDTEGHDGATPVEKLILGETEQGNYGITKIMEICDTYKAKALFFVDVAECWDYGVEKISKVINIILRSGHYIGVHVHPDHMADKNRPFLWQYTDDEQHDILQRATDMYIELVGERPLFFRAGKYGANRKTLEIIEELGYKYDFSQFCGSKWCKIDPPVAINYPKKLGSLTEIPVTAFSALKIGKIEKIEKVDMEMSTLQFKYAVKKLAKQNDRIISLFFHSFSLLNWREDPDNPTQNKRNTKKIHKALEFVTNQSNIEFCTPDELDEIVTELAECTSDDQMLEIRNPLISYCFILLTALRIAEFNRKAKIIIYAHILALIVITLLILGFLL